MADNDPPDEIPCYKSARIRAQKNSVGSRLSECHTYVLTAAERSRRYREALKKNSKKMNDFLMREKERKRTSWKNRTEEQKERDRKKSRERQQRFRDKRKSMGVVAETSKCTKTVLTRSEREKKRDYWRKKKAESRSRRSAQKSRRSKEKDKKYRTERRATGESEPKRSRQKKCLPEDPQQFVSAIENIIDKATPRKLQLMKENHILMTPRSKKKLVFYEKTSKAMQKTISQNPETKKKVIRNLAFLKKYRLNRTLSTYLGVSDSYICKVGQSSVTDQTKQIRKDATSEADKKKVSDFFNRADVSTNLPSAKRVKKDLQERRVLDRPITNVYKEFQEQHPDVNVSLSTFVRNKPRNIESTRRQPWYGCLCDSCTNIDLKLKAISQVAAKHKSEVRVKDKYDALSKTLCKKQEGATYHKLSCIQRKCHDCSSDNIVRFFQPLVEESENDTVSYSKWERVKRMYRGKELTQIMPVAHTESVTALVINLSMELENLAEHLFVASWQHNQFTWLQKNVPESWVVLNMDFAENYSCVAQHEVQSAHWAHNQVTIHPTVAYYRCIEEGCEDVVTEHLMFVTDDLTHDAAAVQEFVKLANKHLIETRGLTITKLVQMTDGCSAQYKSRTPFADISFSQYDLGVPVERHFYGSRHGKGPSDGAGAVMKSAVRRGVMGGNVTVNNSKEFYSYAKDKMTKNDESHKHFKRTIFHVDHIEHNRPDRSEQCKTLKGTRSVHAVKGVDSFLIHTRNLSCFCEVCIVDGHDCKNRDYIEEWKLHDIGKVDRCKRGRGRGERGREEGRRGRGGVRIRGGRRGGGLRIRGGGRGGGLRVRGGGRGGGLRVRGGGTGDPGIRGQTRGGCLRSRAAVTRCNKKNRESETSDSTSSESNISFSENSSSDTETSSDEAEVCAQTVSTDQTVTVRQGEYEPYVKEGKSSSDEYASEKVIAADHISTVAPIEDVTRTVENQSSSEKLALDCTITLAQIEEDVPFTDCSDDDAQNIDISYLMEIINVNFSSADDLAPTETGDHATLPSEAMGTSRSDELGRSADDLAPPETGDHTSLPSEAMVTSESDELGRSADLVSSADDLAPTETGDHATLPSEAMGTSRSDEMGRSADDLAPTETGDHTSLPSEAMVTSKSEELGRSADLVSSADDLAPTETGDHATLPSETMGTSRSDELGRSADDLAPPETGDHTSLPSEAMVTSESDELGHSADLVYAVGQFVLTKHGKQRLPAVVIQTPDCMESRPAVGVWVQYFRKAGRDLWRMEDKPFFLETFNVDKCLDQPLITASGARLYYKF